MQCNSVLPLFFLGSILVKLNGVDPSGAKQIFFKLKLTIGSEELHAVCKLLLRRTTKAATSFWRQNNARNC